MAKVKKRKKVLLVAGAGVLILGGIGFGAFEYGKRVRFVENVAVTNHQSIVGVLKDVKDTYGDNIHAHVFGGVCMDPIRTSDLGKLADGIRLLAGEKADDMTFTHFIAIGPKASD